MSHAIDGIFDSPALLAAGWGFASTFVLCLLLVVTKRWHGALTLDFTDGVQKFHTAPTPRVGGVPIVLGLVLAWVQTPADMQAMLTPFLLAGLPAFLFGLAEDMPARGRHAALAGHHGLGPAGLVDHQLLAQPG